MGGGGVDGAEWGRKFVVVVVVVVVELEAWHDKCKLELSLSKLSR